MTLDFVPLLALGLVVYTILNFVKFLTNRQWNAAVTLLAGWGAGIGAAFLFGATVWANEVNVGGKLLSDIGGWDKVVLGLVLVSVGSFGYDLKRSFDNTDSAQTPPLVRTEVPTPPAPPSGP